MSHTTRQQQRYMARQPGAEGDTYVLTPSLRKELDAAKACVGRIEDYWRKMGYRDIRAWVERDADPDQRKGLFVVRSNLVNGLPPGHPDDAGTAAQRPAHLRHLRLVA